MKAMRLPGRAAGLLLLVVAAACSRKPASIRVSPSRVLIYGIERSQRLTAQVLDKKGRPIDEARPVWTSSNPAIAAVDEGGRVVSKSEGRTTVTVQADQATGEVSVRVVDAATIDVVPSQATLLGPTGTTFPLTATVTSSKSVPVAVSPTWESSDDKVVKVAPDGVATILADGTAAITAQVGELQGAADLEVHIGDIARLEVRPATALVRIGDSQKFQVAAYAPDGQKIENALAHFESSNPAVATIDGAGVASGVAAGTATIRVELAGQAAEATLIVN